MVVNPAPERRTARAASSLASTLSDASGLNLTVEFVASTADAVAALCNSSNGRLTAAWVDALGYAATRALDCGIPELWVERGSSRDRSPLATLQFIVPTNSTISAPSGLAGSDFCRVSVTDYVTWRTALLLMHANRLDPSSLGSVRDLEDVAAVVEAVAAGTCSAVVDARDLDTNAVGAVRAQIRVLDQEAQLPHLTLMFPREIPLGTRRAIDTAFLGAERDADLALVLTADGITQVDEDLLTAFHRFLEQTGLDFARLGT
ncbi:MAG: phosphate/phosphite/phosphonate ABC transporter substrate-binding protein [Anaerolinea sp.]|nr:phosphate/phosphite/phosphonate ABC transporter substrate-binding protein [Anaerolinea sp.]